MQALRCVADNHATRGAGAHGLREDQWIRYAAADFEEAAEPKAEAAPKGPSSSGAVKDEKPTDPNTPKAQSEIDKLKKDEKAGNKSTGG